MFVERVNFTDMRTHLNAGETFFLFFPSKGEVFYHRVRTANCVSAGPRGGVASWWGEREDGIGHIVLMTAMLCIECLYTVLCLCTVVIIFWKLRHWPITMT